MDTDWLLPAFFSIEENFINYSYVKIILFER